MRLYIRLTEILKIKAENTKLKYLGQFHTNEF